MATQETIRLLVMLASDRTRRLLRRARIAYWLQDQDAWVRARDYARALRMLDAARR